MRLKLLIFSSLLLILVSDAVAKKKKPKLPVVNLTERGEELKSAYQTRMDQLRKELLKELPEIDEVKKSVYLESRSKELMTEKALNEAKKASGAVKRAQGLVGHAKNHWIAKAERGISASKEKLKEAKTQEEKELAQKDLAKWEKSKEEGLQALKERGEKLKEALANEPRLKAELESAVSTHQAAKSATLQSVKALNLQKLFGSDRLDGQLLELVTISGASPALLANFSQKGEREEELIENFLNNPILMKQVAVADGPKKGKLGEALDIYDAIQRNSKKSHEGVLQRLAMAISLEHADPISKRNPVAAKNAPSHIDPVNRYFHYEKAFLEGELDPAFKDLTTWDLRMVVDGNEPDDTLAWGRHMLRNYRPDLITMADYRWRYVASVRTEIRYGSQDNKCDKEDLQFFQNILMNGGICGRRAFFGRFILRAFGIPTTARPQPGHAALTHWTPDGWVVCLGGGWGVGSTKTRYKKDRDFLANTQGRASADEFIRVKRAQWIGDLAGENQVFGFYSGTPGFWYGMSLYEQQDIIERSKAKALAAVGEDIGEANESKVKEKVVDVKIDQNEKDVVMNDDGSITIPAAACVRPTNNTSKIKFMKSNLGGMQLHYERTGKGKETFEYSVKAPKSGKYLLTARVVTPSWKQHLLLSINDSEKLVDMELPFTVGEWETTQPVEVDLIKGENKLVFSRQEERLKGVTVRDFKLSPVGS